MHCPRCGQEQAAGNLKFCSRCGLPLSLVAAVVNNGGVLPDIQKLAAKKGLLTRSNGFKLAALWFIVLDMLLLPLSAVMDGGEIIPLIAIVGFVGAIIIAVASLFFLKNPAPQDFGTSYEANAELASAGANREALPEASTQPAADYAAPVESWKAADTGDLVRPGSVTEGTTRLLKKEEDST